MQSVHFARESWQHGAMEREQTPASLDIFTSDCGDGLAAAVSGAQTALFVPGDRPARVLNAVASRPDLVLIDLEDAVADEAKAHARACVDALFGEYPDLATPTAVRLNPLGGHAGRDDVEWLSAGALAGRLAGLMIAKAESPAALDSLAATPGLAALPLIALIESPLGIAQARTLAAHPAVARLALGAVDLALELDCDAASPTIDAMRAELVLASALARLPGPLDTPSLVVDAPDRVGAEAEQARRGGCGGKLCIHPAQLDPVRAAFRPREAEVSWARRVLASGDGASRLDGQMVDRPVRERARRILAASGAGPDRRPASDA